MTRALRPEVAVRLAASDEDRTAHHHVRHTVFVQEQGIFAEHDRDERDPAALHVVAALGPLVVGAVRLYRLGEPGLWQGDRLAVLRDARRLRVGGPLVRFAVATAGAHGGERMIARVQAANVAFFRHLGWESFGEPAEYRGLSHQMMDIALSQAADGDAALAPAGGASSSRVRALTSTFTSTPRIERLVAVHELAHGGVAREVGAGRLLDCMCATCDTVGPWPR